MNNKELKKNLEGLNINGIMQIEEKGSNEDTYLKCDIKTLNPKNDGKEAFYACISNNQCEDGAMFELFTQLGEQDAGSIAFTMAADARYDCSNKLAQMQWNSETKSASFHVEFPVKLFTVEWLNLAVKSILELNYRYDLISFRQKTLRDALENELITQEQAVKKQEEKEERIVSLISSEATDKSGKASKSKKDNKTQK